MPRNGSGIYSLPQAAFVAGTVISSAAVNSDLSDIATALTGSLPRDGQAGMTGQFKAIDGSGLSPSLSFVNEVNTGLYRGGAGIIDVSVLGNTVLNIDANGLHGSIQGTVPIGTVLDFASNNIPAQWLLCAGQAVSRTTYSTLFSLLGTIFGAGDGSTTFNLPDLRGTVVYGRNNMNGSDGPYLTSGVFGQNVDGIGSRGGNQTIGLSLSQIPAGITSSANNNITVSINSGGTNGGSLASILPGFAMSSVQSFPGSGGNFYPVAGTGSWTSVGTLGGTNAISVTSNNTGGGSQVTTLPPGLILNKIIYAGV